jgi:hypothetical protein
MNSSSIEKLLEVRGAWLKAVKGDDEQARGRESLSRWIAQDYVGFERSRDRLFTIENVETPDDANAILQQPELHGLLKAMGQAGMLPKRSASGLTLDARARRYLSGGWLEELAWLAAMEAGAHEAIHGQVVGWEYQGFTGENEIDLIMRHGKRLSFVSCKALRSELDINDRKHRNRLMDAVHQADNLADHFGRHGEKVAVLVTTDLYDETKNMPRYQALMGKAAVLEVRVIALEELGWDRLVHALRQLMLQE